ncbi:hypothetical protein ACFLT9_04740 [Acidobacteriota bacterium]
MKKAVYLILIVFSLVLTGFAVPADIQSDDVDIEELKKSAPKVFFDCGMCDIDYIRTHITYVNYVRDRKEAQIHVMVTTLGTGSGGREYTLAFIGQLDFIGINDTQTYYSLQTETQDEIREGLTDALKIGLMSFVAKTPIAQRIKINYASESGTEIKANNWNNWVFRVSGSGRISGEESYKTRSLSGSFSANRTTEDFKISMSLHINHNRDVFTISDEDLSSTQESMNFSGLFVKSLGEHWSVGAFIRAGSDSYKNVKYSIVPSPAVEYNLFPYSDSTRRQMRFLYRIGFNIIRYREETIYGKITENLLQESLAVTLSLKEKWGTISTTLEGSHYFHDFNKNRLTFFNILNLRLFKGFSVFMFGGGSRIHDQLSLQKGGATLEEALLKRKQLATSYDYFFSVGFSFTFGSIFTNVVNPRFGSSGHGGISIIIN